MIFLTGSTDGAMQCLIISIVDDTTMDGDVTFTVTLTTADPDVMLGNNHSPMQRLVMCCQPFHAPSSDLSGVMYP